MYDSLFLAGLSCAGTEVVNTEEGRVEDRRVQWVFTSPQREVSTENKAAMSSPPDSSH